MVMTGKEAVSKIEKYFDETRYDEYARYKSWEYCYDVFSKKRNQTDAATIDYLCLHLAFYLASWGMYRGSSFILQKNYKVHTKVVETILAKKYEPLWGVKASELLKDDVLDLLFKVSQNIRTIYATPNYSKEGETNHATDTLITKILLGTFGCVPAYDQYFSKGIGEQKVATKTYNEASIRALAEYYQANYDEFENVRKKISSYGTIYTPMKIIDMCFWQSAVDKEEELRLAFN
jgi:hypothetical protein